MSFDMPVRMALVSRKPWDLRKSEQLQYSPTETLFLL